MRTNRSIPQCTVIPELAYADVKHATDWLCDRFGFSVRLRIADHRVQLNVGDGAIVVTQLTGRASGAADLAHGVLVWIADVDRHHSHAAERGVKIARPPTDHPYGERQYSAVDLGGHVWTFSQSIADVAPESWAARRSSFRTLRPKA